MICKSFVSVCVAVLAVACCCNGLYHFKQKLPNYCDLRIVEYVYNDNYPNEYLMINVSAHGTFFLYTKSVCEEKASKCFFDSLCVIRPDLAEPDMSAKAFYADAEGHCAYQDVRKKDAPHSYDIFEANFVYREPAVYHGKKCFKYYNNTKSEQYFADDTTGTLYGYTMDDMDSILVYSTGSSSPSDYALNPKEYPECAKSVFTLPEQKSYDHACDNAPKVGFLFRQLPFMTQMMKKH